MCQTNKTQPTPTVINNYYNTPGNHGGSHGPDGNGTQCNSHASGRRGYAHPGGHGHDGPRYADTKHFGSGGADSCRGHGGVHSTHPKLC
jgi:hypothetical protein